MSPAQLKFYTATAVVAMTFAASILLFFAIQTPLPELPTLQSESSAKAKSLKVPGRSRYLNPRFEKVFQISSQTPKSDKNKKQLPQSTLKATLQGTVISDLPDETYAVIEVKGVQDLYHVNDAIEGAIVMEIHRKTIVLRQDGKDALLVIPDK